MKPALLRLSRQFAWTAALGALVVLAVGYSALPEQIPLTRWTTESKTPLLVLRVPLVNLLCLVLIHVLERPLIRVHGETSLRENAMRAVAILYATVGVKAFLEALEFLLLPSVPSWLLPLLLVLVGMGMAGVAFAGRPLVAKNAPKLEFTGSEKAVAAFCVLGILALQFPLL